MKPLLIGLCVALLAVPVAATADFALTKHQADWALRHIRISTNAKQRAGYMDDINRYAAVLQGYIGQKPAPCVGDPHAFIEKLEKLAQAKAVAEQKAEAAQRAAAFAAAAQALGPNTSGEDFRRDQRIRDLESQIAAEKVRRDGIDNARRFNEKSKR